MPSVHVSKKGNRYIINFIDHFTSFVVIAPVPKIDSIESAKAFVEKYICRWGCPERFLTDQGRNFISDFAQEIYRLMSVSKIRTTAYHPQCNGKAEQFNKTLAAMISTFV